jgi:hypothetical protein
MGQSSISACSHNPIGRDEEDTSYKSTSGIELDGGGSKERKSAEATSEPRWDRSGLVLDYERVDVLSSQCLLFILLAPNHMNTPTHEPCVGQMRDNTIEPVRSSAWDLVLPVN